MQMQSLIAVFNPDEYRPDQKLRDDIVELFVSLSHLSVDESCTDEGLRQVIVAFRKFLKSQNCINALANFEKLLKEKDKNDGNGYRANGRTPNVLHEIRNCMQSLGMILAEKYHMPSYLEHGGLDTDMTARIRHDSIEDCAESEAKIHIFMIENLHRLINQGDISKDVFYRKMGRTEHAAHVVNLMTRKEAIINPETKEPMREANGRIVKRERYGGDTNVYFYRLLEDVFALLTKYPDRSENVGTRKGGTGFSLDSDVSYARETREIYHLENFVKRACDLYPEFAEAIQISDDMLGLQVLILEGINKYQINTNIDPAKGEPFDLGRYLPNALRGSHFLPPFANLVTVAINEARHEAGNDPRLNMVIDRLIIPPIQKAIHDHGLTPISGIAHNPENVPIFYRLPA